MTDKTNTKRQSRRRAALNALAQSLGYASWARLETAALRFDVAIIVVNQTSDNAN